MSETGTEKLARRDAVAQQLERYHHMVLALHPQLAHWDPLLDHELTTATEALLACQRWLAAQEPTWAPPRKPRASRDLEPGELVNIKASRREAYAAVLPTVLNLKVEAVAAHGQAITVSVPGSPDTYRLPRVDLALALAPTEAPITA
jgi:hypothetical protein